MARITVVDGVAVAITVIIPCSVRVRTGWVDGAELTLVGCRTALQGRGYGGLAVRDALAHLRTRDMALAMFYGEPGYYPRFGCAPVLPVYRATLPVNNDAGSASTMPALTTAARTVAAGLLTPDELAQSCGGARLELATDADVPTLLKLYEAGMCGYPGALSRSADPWEWRPRSAEVWSIGILADRTGYVVTQKNSDRSELYVREAGVADAQAARRLLAVLVTEARKSGLRQIGASLPPDHLLHRAMSACGGESLKRPASPGFAVIADWAKVLPHGYAVTTDGLAHDGQFVLKAATIPLTQLAMGYLDIDDLLLLPDCSVTGGDAALALLRRDFPRLYPRYSWAPFYLLH